MSGPADLARLDHARELLLGWRYSFKNEKELQDGIEQVLRQVGVTFRREVRLGPGDVVDFMLDGVAIEVKVNGSLSASTRQLSRYSTHDTVRSLLLVSTLNRLDHQPAELNGKPVAVLVLAGGLA